MHAILLDVARFPSWRLCQSAIPTAMYVSWFPKAWPINCAVIFLRFFFNQTNSEKSFLNVILNCILQTIRDIKHILLCLRTIVLSFLYSVYSCNFSSFSIGHIILYPKFLRVFNILEIFIFYIWFTCKYFLQDHQLSF